MTRVFLDSSVLFSACYSSKGHARDIIQMALRDEIQLVCSKFVFEETRRNLARSLPENLLFLNFVIDNLPIELVKASKSEVLAAADHVALKDAPIVAAAKKAKVEYLVTLDKKHLLNNTEIPTYAHTQVTTPQETVNALRE